MENGCDAIKHKISLLDDEIALRPNDADLLYERGKLYWKSGNKGKAMSDFNAAVLIAPDSPAKGYLEMAKDIMDFYNTDLYNP